MRWRDILIGAFITLVVTVVGGVIVYYVTKSPTHEPPAEKLVYQADTAAKFTSESRKLSFQQIRVANVGSSVAQEVIIGIGFSKKAKILDNSVALTSGPAAGEYTVRKENDNTVKIAVATLAPSETISIALLVDLDEPESPSIAVKSNKTIGSNQPIEKQQQPQKEATKKVTDNVMAVLMPLLIFAQFFIVKKFVRPGKVA